MRWCRIAGTNIAKAVCGDIPIAYDDGEGPEHLVKEAERVLAVFLRDPLRPHRVLAVEHHAHVDLVHPITGEAPFEETLVVVFDLVVEDSDGVVRVIDHKISSRLAPPKSSTADVQMALYGYAAPKLFASSKPVELQHHVLLRTQQARVELADIPRVEHDSGEAVDAAFAAIEMIHLAVVHPAPKRLLGRNRSWRCTSCSYRDRCEQPETTARLRIV